MDLTKIFTYDPAKPFFQQAFILPLAIVLAVWMFMKKKRK
jgi:hypothetical protein